MLRQRLGARQAPQAHPDPDLLTAYVEQALGEAERSEVIRHLASCGYCREVVSLSLPKQPVEPVAQPSVAGRRFWIPAFRWSAALATVAIAAALVVEKPWHRTPAPDFQSQQHAPVAPPTKSPEPATSALADDKSQPEAGSTTGGLTANEESTRERGRIADMESHAAEKARAAPRRDLDAKAEVQNGPVQQSEVREQQPRPLALAHVVASAPAPASQPQAKDSAETASVNADGDFVNTGALNQTASNESFTANGQAGADQSALPPPPTPKAGSGGNAQQARSAAPPITGGQISGSAFDYNLQAPQTDQSANNSAPANDKNTLDKMRFAQKVKTRITESAKAMGRLASPSPMAQQFSNSLAAAPDGKVAEAESKKASLQFHWRLTSDGILMKSTDLSQWHEAYPQGSDLQFRAVFTLGQGHQVWAGGNNGTLVHSWNGGVNWDTLKVPEAGSNDITAISIDDGWQVKTSDGQTFVSHDQGKTWVPLKQN